MRSRSRSDCNHVIVDDDWIELKNQQQQPQLQQQLGLISKVTG